MKHALLVDMHEIVFIRLDGYSLMDGNGRVLVSHKAI